MTVPERFNPHGLQAGDYVRVREDSGVVERLRGLVGRVSYVGPMTIVGFPPPLWGGHHFFGRELEVVEPTEEELYQFSLLELQL